MSGISVKLPMHTDGATGKYALNKSYADMIRQNFKHLILTNPGERIMLPDFGAGIIKLLFELGDGFDTRLEIESRIKTQADIYMPFVEIVNIEFTGSPESPEIEPNLLSIRLHYRVTPLSLVDFLNITV